MAIWNCAPERVRLSEMLALTGHSEKQWRTLRHDADLMERLDHDAEPHGSSFQHTFARRAVELYAKDLAKQRAAERERRRSNFARTDMASRFTAERRKA